MARIYVIDDDEQLLRMVGLMLERGGHTVTLLSDPIKGMERVKQDKPDLLVLDVMMPAMSGHDITRQLRDTKGLENLPILILTARSQEIDKTTALKIGANDYLSKPVTSQELIERVDHLLTQKPDSFSPDEGMVISFFGLRGGVGKTTLAVNLAAALRRLSQQEVCLVDLSPSGSQVIMHLRLQARTTWADVINGNEPLDWSNLKNHLVIHPTGLRILAAPARPASPNEPSAEAIVTMLEMLRDNMVFTVVDLPPVLSPAFMAALETTDIALHVLSPDVVSVQTAAQLNRHLTKTGISFRQKSLILNQTVPEAQLPKATVERGLNARIAFHVEHDPNQLRALSQGVPLALTTAKSPLPSMSKRTASVIWKRVTS